MRRAVSLMSVAVLAGLSVGVAEAAGGGPKATGGAHAVGADGRVDLSFNAQGTVGQPLAAKGHVNYRAVPAMGAATSFKGRVTCYSQEGNRAAFSGIVTKSDDAALETFYFEVIDNGEGSAITPPGDGFRFVENEDETECAVTDMPSDTFVTNGNIQVHETE